jgi:hypothetical protein
MASLKKDVPMKTLALPATGNVSIGAVAKVAVLLAVVTVVGTEAAQAGADQTFKTALTSFTGFLEGSGGKIITVMSLAGGIVGLASGRFSLGQVAIPVGVGVGAGTGVPIVTAAVTATI